MFSLSILILFNLSIFANSYNYLIVNPIFAYSHVKFMAKVADTLADHNHKVTLFQPFHMPMKNLEGLTKNKNVEVLNYYPSHYEEMKNNEDNTFPFMWDMNASPALTALMLPSMFIKEWNKTASEVLGDPKLFTQLKNKNFDAVMAETFEISGMYLAHLLQLPLIASLSAVRFGEMNLYFGGSSILGYVPAYGSKLGKKAGFLDRLNDVYTAATDSVLLHSVMRKQQRMCQDAVGDDVQLPHWKDLFFNSTMYLTNSNPYLDFAVPSIGSLIQIGGFTMNLNKDTGENAMKLPDEYNAIMSERKHTVLISFGSVIRSFQMPDSFKSGIIEAMKNLPEITFIWKYEKDDDLEFRKRLSSNVHLKKWVPQTAILADARLSLFVTHGGLGSTMELAYSGIAALMVPIFGDQPHNAMMLERHGGAIAYDRFELSNGEKLTRIIKEMTDNPIYKTKAVELRDVLHNQPIDPKDLLVKNMEFAVKFPRFRSQIPEISSSGFIGYYYLDVFVFLALVAVVSLVIAVKITTRIYRKVASFSRKPKED